MRYGHSRYQESASNRICVTDSGFVIESSGRNSRPDDFCLQLVFAGGMLGEDGLIDRIPGGAMY